MATAFALILACPWGNLAKNQVAFWHGESLWCCSVGTCPQHWQLILAGDPDRADSDSWVSLPSIFYPDRTVLIRLRAAEKGNCGAYGPWKFWGWGFIRIRELLLWIPLLPITQCQLVPNSTWKGNSGGIAPGLCWGKTGWLLCTRITAALHEIRVASAGIFES